MTGHDWLADRFEKNRSRLRAVAYRMLGSLNEADDAVQESWLRLSRAAANDIDNLDAWLTTVVARVCLNMLRSRKSRREEPLDVHMPDPIVSRGDAMHPEHAVLLADSVGLALFVILETLDPDERLAFVLHDMFGVPFDDIAPIVGRSTAAARQLASRARRRVKDGAVRVPEVSLARQREVVDAFLAAARAGDFDALLAVLDPDVVRYGDDGVVARGAARIVRGARHVAEGALAVSRLPDVRPAIVNGAAGLLGFDPAGRLVSVIGFAVAQGKIVEIDVFLDPARLSGVDVSQREN